MLIIIKTRHFHNSVKHQEYIFHRKLITEVFKNSCFIEKLQKQSFADVLHHRWRPIISYFRHVNIAKLLRTTFLYICRRSKAVVQRCSVKTGVLTNFTKFTGNHLCQSLILSKVAGLRLATFLKRDSGTSVFRWILWNFTEHLWTTASDLLQMFFKKGVLGALLKKLTGWRLQQRRFSVKFSKILRTPFYRTPPVNASAHPLATSVLFWKSN